MAARAAVPTFLACAAILAVAGCGRPVDAAQGCTQDADCGNLQVCEKETGTCLCTENAACDATEFCNSAGRCQATTGCESNEDCRTPERPTDICDTTSGVCVTLNASSVQCILDSHCPFGSYCDNKRCAPGCRDNGDCMIGQPCIDGQCDSRPGACNENAFCAYGDFCDMATNTCRSHRMKSTLCQPCRPKVCLSNSDCPAGVQCVQPDPFSAGECEACDGAFCLIDASIPADPCTSDSQCPLPGSYCVKAACLDESHCGPGETCVGGSPGGFFEPPRVGECSRGACGAFFCGTDRCDDTTDVCPRGYNCQQIRVVVQPCTVGGNECTGGRSCSAGGENNAAGFCSCIADSDCPAGGVCQNPGPYGACLIGSSCGPQSGLVCSDLL